MNKKLSKVGGADLAVQTFEQACHFDERSEEKSLKPPVASAILRDFSQKTLEMTTCFLG